MTRSHTVAVVLVVGLAAACDRTDPKPAPGRAAEEPSTCASDSDCAAPSFCGSDGVCNTLRVGIDSPSADTYVQCRYEEAIRVVATITAERNAPEAIDVRIDGQSIGGLQSGVARTVRLPAGFAEGEHLLTVHARMDAHEVASEPRRIVVDRTPPTLVASRPDPALAEYPETSFFELEFSEPVAVLDLNMTGAANVTPLPFADPRVVRIPGSARDVLTLDVIADVQDLARNHPAPVSVRWSQPPLAVSLYATAERLPFVDGEVPFTIEISGGTADRVVITRDALDDDQFELFGPPYAWTWNAAAAPDGQYGFWAVAYRGARAFASTASFLAVDRTPPRVTVAPAVGPITARETFTVTFDEAVVEPRNADGFRIVDDDGRAVPLDVIPYESGTSVMALLRPSAPLPPGTATVEIAGSFHDAAGWATSPVALTFEVPPWFPTAERAASLGGPFRVRELVASNARDVEGLWESSPAGGPGLVYRGTPSNPGRVAFIPAGAWEPASARDWFGYTWFAWTEAAADGRTTVHALQEHGTWNTGAFTSPLGAREPAIGIRARLDSAYPFLAWTQDAGGVPQVRAARWTGGAWTGPFDPTGGSAVASHARVVVGLEDDILLAWLDGSTAVPQVRVRRFTPAGDWDPAIGLPGADPASPASPPALALGEDGTAAVAWSEPLAGRQEVRVAIWDGTAWQALAAIRAAGDAVEASVAVGASGAIPVAYVDDQGAAGRFLRVAELVDGAWVERNAPLNAGSGEAAYPVAAFAQAPEAPCVAWSEHGDARIACANR